VGPVFEKINVHDLKEPFVVLKEEFGGALVNGKTDFIPEITKLLSKFYRDPRDLVWIKQMSIKIKESTPEPIRHDLFDKFVKSISWDKPMSNDRFYKIVQDLKRYDLGFAIRMVKELENPARKFAHQPANKIALDKAIAEKNNPMGFLLATVLF
jgi:hypothetical protein